MKLADFITRPGPRADRLRRGLGLDENAAFHLLVTVDVIAAFHLLVTVDVIAALQQVAAAIQGAQHATGRATLQAKGGAVDGA